MLPSDFWPEEWRDLKSKLRALAITFALVLPPAGVLLWIGVPQWIVNGLAVAVASGLGLVWFTVRLWDDLHWGPLIDLEPFKNTPRPRAESAATDAIGRTVAPPETQVVDLTGMPVHTIEQLGAFANLFRVRSADEPRPAKKKTPPRARVDA